MEDFQHLIQKVREVRLRAHAPYSHFYVGSVVEYQNLAGETVTQSGCNVENASYGLTICAERNALAAMVSLGFMKVMRIIVFADTPDFTPPCGACRQVMEELAPEAICLLLNSEGDIKEISVETLLPGAFQPKHLGTEK